MGNPHQLTIDQRRRIMHEDSTDWKIIFPDYDFIT